MRKTCMFGVAVLLFWEIGMTGPADAAVSIWADVGGTSLSSTTAELILSPANTVTTYGAIKIQGTDTTLPAKVVVTDSGTGDLIMLWNVKITAVNTSAPVNNYFMTIWASMDGGPTNPPNVHYKTTVDGKFGGRPKPTGDNITVNGYLQAPPLANPVSGGSWGAVGGSLNHTVSCPLSGSCDILGKAIFSKSTAPPTTGFGTLGPTPQQRALKTVIRFTLANGLDFLQLGPTATSPNGSVVTVTAQQGGGGGGLMSTFCPTTESTAKALDCTDCVSEDGIVLESARVSLFAKSSWENLASDLARGQGEYLASLAVLLQIPQAQQSTFFQLAQNWYVSSHKENAPNELIAWVQEKPWSQ